jgi:hypothetical protein
MHGHSCLSAMMYICSQDYIYINNSIKIVFELSRYALLHISMCARKKANREFNIVDRGNIARLKEFFSYISHVVIAFTYDSHVVISHDSYMW